MTNLDNLVNLADVEALEASTLTANDPWVMRLCATVRHLVTLLAEGYFCEADEVWQQEVKALVATWEGRPLPAAQAAAQDGQPGPG